MAAPFWKDAQGLVTSLTGKLAQERAWIRSAADKVGPALKGAAEKVAALKTPTAGASSTSDAEVPVLPTEPEPVVENSPTVADSSSGSYLFTITFMLLGLAVLAVKLWPKHGAALWKQLTTKFPIIKTVADEATPILQALVDKAAAFAKHAAEKALSATSTTPPAAAAPSTSEVAEMQPKPPDAFPVNASAGRASAIKGGTRSVAGSMGRTMAMEQSYVDVGATDADGDFEMVGRAKWHETQFTQ